MATEAPSDEEMRKLLKPNCTAAQVEEAIKKNFCKAASGGEVKIVKSLDSYDDQNFVALVDGTKFLAKVHNGVESKDFTDAYNDSNNATSSVIQFQNAVMQQLISSGIRTSNPQTCPETNLPLAICSLPVVSKQHSPYQLVLKLMTWVPGRTMSSLPALPIECLANAGTYLAKMRTSLDQMEYTRENAAARRFHAWDGKNTLRVRDFIGAITDSRKRGMVESIISTFEKNIIDSGVGGQFRKGIIQGDFNDANILVDEDFFISGAIDFGDSVESWTILDLSVGMAYAMLTVYGQKNKSIAAMSAMLRAYSQVYPLQELELQHLHLLVACRLACSVTLGAFSYQQNPGNKYLLLHAQPAWDALELIWGYDDDSHRHSMATSLQNVFDKACNPSVKESLTDLEFPDPSMSDLMKDARVSDSNNKRRKLDDTTRPTITFVTGNQKKLEEVKRMLGNKLGFGMTNVKLDLPELQGDDTIEIAKEKCLEAVRQVGGAVMTEDTSLCYNALNGLPGPYIKWFLKKCGLEGLNQMLDAHDDKTAYAQTVVAFCPGPNQEVTVFDGRCSGNIVPARGKLDFGWDPVFEPTEGDVLGKTYGEMSKDEKDAISQRGRAMALLKDYLMTNEEAVKKCMA